MATIEFIKYHGTGNDFILMDNRKGRIALSREEIALLCHRRLGIGADGLMLLNASVEFDFEMKYYNADGGEGTMCGNGGRCIASFARELGIIGEKTAFKAIDGVHRAVVRPFGKGLWQVEISLNDVRSVEKPDDSTFILDTGSPHYVKFVPDLDAIDVYSEGKRIRWDERFRPGGINVNFAERRENLLKVMTFERGVEDITLSCGTGVTACALAASADSHDGSHSVNISTPGGDLTATFNKNISHFSDIWLKGPAKHVFAGSIALNEK